MGDKNFNLDVTGHHPPSESLKREVDSLDDFEHLDSSPVGGKPSSTANINKIDTTNFDPLMSNNKMDLLDLGDSKTADMSAPMLTGVTAVKDKDVLNSFIERERGEFKTGHGDPSERLERYSDSENEDDFKLSKQTIESKDHFKDFEEFHNASSVDKKTEEQKHIEEEKQRLAEEKHKEEEERRLEEQRRLEQERREAEEQQRLEEERKRKETEEKKRLEEEEKKRLEEEKCKREEEERKKLEQQTKRIEEEKKQAEELVCKRPVCELKPKSKTAVTEAEVIFYKMGLDAWFNPERLNPKVESLIYWRDPKKSGPVFGGVLLVLLALTYFSLISVVAYLSLLVLTGTICFRIYKNIVQAVQKTGDGHPFKDLLELDVSLSQDKVKAMSEVAVAHLNAAVVELRRLFLVEDLVDSIKFGVLLWTLTYLGALFNGMTLIIIAWVALFTFPKVYETNKTQIDANLDLVRTKLADITTKVKAAIPIGKKTEEKKEQ